MLVVAADHLGLMQFRWHGAPAPREMVGKSKMSGLEGGRSAGGFVGEGRSSLWEGMARRPWVHRSYQLEHCRVVCVAVVLRKSSGGFSLMLVSWLLRHDSDDHTGARPGENQTKWSRLRCLPYTTSSLGRPSRKRFRVRLWRCLGPSAMAHSPDAGAESLSGIAKKEAFRLRDMFARAWGDVWELSWSNCSL